MTFNMYWLHHSINLLKIVPFLGGWLSDRLLGDPEGWPHPIVWFGKAISAGEKALNKGSERALKGGILAVVLILGVYLICERILSWAWIIHPQFSGLLTAVGVFYCLSGKTSDLLLEAPIPGTSGLNTIMRNIGSVQNQGFELTLNTHNIQTDNFNWMSTVLFNVNRNKILNLGENDEDIYPKPRHAQGDMLILRVGEPVGSLWGLRRLGTWGEDEAAEAAKYNRLPGDVKYEDLNGDGKINSEDNTIIGCTSPDWTMTISNTFLYKNFDFSFDLRFVFGNDVVNCATHNAEDRSGVANGFKSNLNAWTPQNQHTMVAQRRPMKSYYDSYPDSHWMQNGSFVRGQNFVLGYTFSKSLLQKIKLQDLRIYASAQNLFCITKYKGYDPEVTTYEDAAFGQGIDDFSEPKARTFTFGLNVKF